MRKPQHAFDYGLSDDGIWLQLKRADADYWDSSTVPSFGVYAGNLRVIPFKTCTFELDSSAVETFKTAKEMHKRWQLD